MATYKGSLKRFETLSRFVLALITLTLAMFLVLLGDKVLSDMDGWFTAPKMVDFENRAELSRVDKNLQEVNSAITALTDQRYRLEKSLEIAQRNYRSEKESFENWLKTAGAIGSPNENAQVLARAKQLDRLRKAEEEWRKQIDAVNESVRPVDKERTTLQEKREEIRKEGYSKFERAMDYYQLKLFFARLALVGPILALGVFVFARYRKSSFRALAWGYILFSLYAFFVGLVPYLPSFGGYIRYAVGILLTVLAGYYVIRELARYIERKKTELRETSQERARKIEHQTALKAFQSHCCPSCETDFLMNKWHPQTKMIKDVVLMHDAPAYCPQCGLLLFDQCRKCGAKNFVHFPYCSSCGKPIREE